MRTAACAAVLAAVSWTADARVPSVAELGTRWVEAVPLRSIGPVQNFWGSVGLRGAPPAGTRRIDLVSLDAITTTPFHGQMINASLEVNGESLHVERTKWIAYESSRASQPIKVAGAGGPVRVVNSVRMPFEANIILSRYTFAMNDTDAVRGARGKGTNAVKLKLTGPIMQHCEDLGGCGWGATMPTDPALFEFTRRSEGDVGVVTLKAEGTPQQHPVTSAISVLRVPKDRTRDLVPLSLRVARSEGVPYFAVSGGIACDEEFVIVLSSGHQADAVKTVWEVRNMVQRSLFDAAWHGAASRWETRWKHAFSVGNPHYSGHLPELSTDDADMERTYYSTILAAVSLERTNLPLHDRVYTISQGDVHLLDASHDMGGAGEFVWDLAFCGVLYTLLDPAATKAVLRHYMAYTEYPKNETDPFEPPQTWDVYLITNPIGGSIYGFDYYAAFEFFSTYLRLTNDREFLDEEVPGKTYLGKPVTTFRYMELLGTSYRRFPSIPGTAGQLTDYGYDLRHFLEVIPTYIGALPALNFGNANMLHVLGKIMGNATMALEGKSRADAALIFGYHGDGSFDCLYNNGTKVNVRAISDFIYITQQMCVLDEGDLCDAVFPKSVRKQMADYAWDEMYDDATGFTRALSRKDKVFSVHDLLINRADWGAHGTYPGCTGMFVEAMAAMDGNYDRAVQLFRSASRLSRTDAWAQGIAIDTPTDFINNCSAAAYYNFNNHRPAPEPPYAPAWPEYFADLVTWWPNSLRGLANNAGAFGDAMIRGLFGYNPTWATFGDAAPEAKKYFMHGGRARPFEATLAGLWLPDGKVVDLTASKEGVQVTEVGVSRRRWGAADPY